MKISANIDSVKLIDWHINTGEVNVRVLAVEMSEELKQCSVAFVTFKTENEGTYESKVKDGVAEIPYFSESQWVEIGLYTSDMVNGELKKQYSPKPAKRFINKGSFCAGAEPLPKPTPGDYAELLYEIAKANEPITTGKIEDDAVTIDKVASSLVYDLLKVSTSDDIKLVMTQIPGSKRGIVTAYLANKLTEFKEVDTDKEIYSAKTINNIVAKLKTEIMGELDEIGDLVGGETEEATELVADLGDIEFAYSSGDGGYVGNFTLPDVPLEKNKRYAISVDGKEYKSTVAEVEGRLYLCNDAREDLGILAMCQDNNWSIVILTSSDFSGTHNIKIYAGPNDKKAYQVVAYMATSNTGAYSFHTDEFDAGNYGLVIRDDNGTEYYNNPLRRLSADAVFGFKSCDKDYSDVSLTQVYNAIAEGKTLSFIVTGDIDGVETTKTYTLGTPDFEWTNSNNQRHY